MPASSFRINFSQFRQVDLVALAAIILLMVASWYLINGVVSTVYEQYETFGDPPKSMGPGGGIGKSQQGHTAFFWSERAFHYRTTLMFAVDDYDDPGTLKNDILQQHPDGVNSWAEYTLLMEPVYGQLYRWFGKNGESLAEFLLRLIPLVHVLLFLPLFFLARSLGARPWLAFAGVLIYATCTMGFSRIIGSLLLKENFALLWLMIFLAAHHRASVQRNFSALVVAALAMILALASWHLSQFLFLVVFLAAGFSKALWGQSEGTSTENPAKGFWPGPWWQPAVYLLAGVLAGFTPSLLNRGFFISLPMAALMAWLFSAWWGERRSNPPTSLGMRLGCWIAPLMVFGLLAAFNPLVHGDYNHVSGLFFQKIIHGFVRPSDPSSLPFDVRVFWAPPFTSPNASGVSSSLGFHIYLILAAGFWFVFSIIRRQLPRHLIDFLFTLLAFLMAWLMIERMGVVFWPLMAVAIVLAAEQLLSAGNWRGRGNPVLVVGLLLLLAPLLNMGGILKPQIDIARQIYSDQIVSVGISDGDNAPFKVELFDWLRRETPGPGSSFSEKTDGGFLGEVGVSSQILLYARRPVVLNGQFENSLIRQRYKTYLELLYGTDEKGLAAFFEQTDSAYLFINRNWGTTFGPGSVAWQAGVPDELATDMMIVRMHFRPESFSFLQPVFDNDFYRVFRVGGNRPNDPTQPTWQGNKGAWWNEENFTVTNGKLIDPQASRQKIADFEDQWFELQNQMQMILAPLNQQARSGNPPLMALHQQRLQLYFNKYTGQGDASANHLTELQRRIAGGLKQPHPIQPYAVGQLLLSVWQGLPGEQGMKALLSASPAGPVNYASAGQLLGMLDQYEMAADQLLKAASFFPLKPMRRGRGGQPVPLASAMASQLRQECVWWNIGAQRFELASQLAADFLPFEIPGSRQAKFYQALIKAARTSP